MAKDPVLQVEQLFDDGSHPAIVQELFAGEYGSSSSSCSSAGGGAVLVIDGQLTIENT